MGEAIEDLKAVYEMEKRNRRASWERRGEAVAELKTLGFDAVPLDADQQHWRIKLPGHRYLDFWPSTWRWHEKRKGSQDKFSRGNSFESMKARLEQISIPQG